MSWMTIEHYDNFSIELTDNVKDYCINGEILDLYSPAYKKKNKSKPLKEFTLQIRVSKIVAGKRKYKKKKLSYSAADNTTLYQALNDLYDLPNELLKELEAPAPTKKTAVTLGDVWDEFYDHKVNGTDSELKEWKATTARTYDSFYNLWIKDGLGKMKIEAVTKEDINSLINTVKKQRTLRTASTVIEVLSPLYNWYIETNDLPMRNPVPKKKKKVFDFQNERVVDVSLPQVKKLFTVIDEYENDTFRNILKWVRLGRRRGEVLSLKLDDIDLEDRTFTIQAANNKAGVDMTYPLLDDLINTLPEGREEGYLFDVHVDSINKHWKKVKEKVGGTFKLNGKRVPFGELHLHDLRHIVNGILKELEVSQEVREKVLGHKNNSINDRYGKAYYGDIEKAQKQLLGVIYE